MESLVLSTSSPAHLTFQSTGEIQKHGRDGACFTERIKKALKHSLGRTNKGPSRRDGKSRRGTRSRGTESGDETSALEQQSPVMQ